MMGDVIERGWKRDRGEPTLSSERARVTDPGGKAKKKKKKNKKTRDPRIYRRAESASARVNFAFSSVTRFRVRYDD